MKFRISIDDSTRLGMVLSSLPGRNRQARLIELATFGLMASETSNSARGFSEVNPVRLEAHIKDDAKFKTPSSVSSIESTANKKAEDGIIDFGDLQNI